MHPPRLNNVEADHDVQPERQCDLDAGLWASAEDDHYDSDSLSGMILITVTS